MFTVCVCVFRFSGVTEEDLDSATMRLRDVQAVLLSMFSAESILIGHSLESDLFALKVTHTCTSTQASLHLQSCLVLCLSVSVCV